MDEKRYSREQVAAILRRSAEIEGEKLRTAPSAELSLEDLEQIAEESGLDPASVRAAARELRAGPPEDVPPIPPSPPGGARLHHERHLVGELDEAGLEQLVRSAGARLGLAGRVTREGDDWRWSEGWGRRVLSARAGCRQGRTRIELEEDLRAGLGKLRGGIMATLGSFGLAFGFAFGLNVESTVAGGAVFAALGLAGSLAAGFGVAQLMFQQRRAGRDAQLRSVITELEREARDVLQALPGRDRSVAEKLEGDAPGTPRLREDPRRDGDSRGTRPRDRS